MNGKALQVRSDLLDLTTIEKPWRTVAKITATFVVPAKGTQCR